MEEERYELLVVCEECEREIGSVHLSIPTNPSSTWWAIQTMGSQVGDLVKVHRMRMQGDERMGGGDAV